MMVFLIVALALLAMALLWVIKHGEWKEHHLPVQRRLAAAFFERGSLLPMYWAFELHEDADIVARIVSNWERKGWLRKGPSLESDEFRQRYSLTYEGEKELGKKYSQWLPKAKVIHLHSHRKAS